MVEVRNRIKSFQIFGSFIGLSEMGSLCDVVCASERFKERTVLKVNISVCPEERNIVSIIHITVYQINNTFIDSRIFKSIQDLLFRS